MVLTIQQGFTYAIMIGGIVGLAIGLRKVIQMEKKILKMDSNVEKIVKKIEKIGITIEDEVSEIKEYEEEKDLEKSYLD